MVKVVHCPSFAEKLFAMIDNIGSVAPSTNSLLFSIYYTALSSCTAREARQRFGESREDLMQRYSRHFESAVGHSFDVPSLESLQSLVLYMVSRCVTYLGIAIERTSNTLRLLFRRFPTTDIQEVALSICSKWRCVQHKCSD